MDWADCTRRREDSPGPHHTLGHCLRWGDQMPGISQQATVTLTSANQTHEEGMSWYFTCVCVYVSRVYKALLLRAEPR